MRANLFADLVKKHFCYLLEEYKFEITEERYFPEAGGSAQVVFASLSTGIGVVLDRGQVLINMGEIAKPQREWFEFSDVVRYFADDVVNVYVFDEDHADLESQVIRLAQIMRKYCRPLLVGDFSRCKEIREIEDLRVSEMIDKFSRRRD